jgi:hypothetical protein
MLTLAHVISNAHDTRYAEEVGGTSSVLTFRKDNLVDAYNKAHTGACDTDNV